MSDDTILNPLATVTATIAACPPGPEPETTCFDTKVYCGQRHPLTLPSVAVPLPDAELSRPRVAGRCTTPPGAATVPATVPAELAELDQWVVTKLVHGVDKNGNPKTDKPPMALGRTGDRLFKVSHGNPAQWLTYEAARAIVAAGIDGVQAVGFVFSDCDPYTGLDFDGCRDPETGAIEPWAARWVAALDSYTEISRSGAGLKTWVRGKLPAAFKHQLGPHKGIEVYSRQRFFWMTGNRLEGTPDTIRAAQDVLEDLVRTLTPPKPQPAPSAPRVSPGERAAGRLSLAEARARFNAEHSLAELLRGYGAEERRGGYSCPFCTHTHAVTLYISERGRLFSYSTLCKLHTTKGWDAFGLYTLIEHGDNITAALRACNPPPARPKAEHPPHPAEVPEYLTPQQAERRRQDAARKRKARQDEAAARLAAARNKLDSLTARGRAVLLQLLGECERAGGYTCRPSNAALASAIGISERTVQRAFAELETAGIGERRGGANTGGRAETAVWTFAPADATRVTGGEAVVTLIDHETHVLENHGACERGAVDTLPARGEMWSPKEVWQDSAAGRQALADRWQMKPETELAELDAGDVAEQQELAVFAPEPTPAPAVVFGPPRDPATARRYWALLGKARKVGPSNPHQAEALRRQAQRLEEPQSVDELPSIAPPPRSPAPRIVTPLALFDMPARLPSGATSYRGPTGDVHDPESMALVAQYRARYATAGGAS